MVDGRPNILLVMADQVVPFLTGPYGDPAVQTPALDRLADQGVTFDAAYTAVPLCSPSRAALLAGRDASALGVFDNASVFPADQPTLGHYLSAHGYDTALSGKMHFVGPDQLHGFRTRLTTDVFPAGVDWVPELDEEGRFPAGGHARHYAPPDPGVRPWTMFRAYDEETQFRARQYLLNRSLEEQSDPFCLVVSYHHPHDPFHVSQEAWDRYEDAEIPLSEPDDTGGLARSVMDDWADDAHETAAYDLRDPAARRITRRAYYAALSSVDDMVGQLLEALETTGELENTLVLFTSDHGDMMTERGMVQKRCFYEWSARVPLIARFPDALHAGTRIAQPVSLIDLLPTVLDVVGVPEPRRAHINGRSLLPLIARADSDHDFASPTDTTESPVFSEYHLEKVFAPCFMVRLGHFKYILVHEHDEQLFDLDADPGERTDLSEDPAHQEVRDALRALVLDRFDPVRLSAEGRASIARRAVVRDAMRHNGTHWDYEPRFDPTTQFVR
jgi:choline-sulfatase